MQLIIKLNNHLEDTKRVSFIKPNTDKNALRDIFTSEILFRFSAE